MNFILLFLRILRAIIMNIITIILLLKNNDLSIVLSIIFCHTTIF